MKNVAQGVAYYSFKQPLSLHEFGGIVLIVIGVGLLELISFALRSHLARYDLDAEALRPYVGFETIKPS